MMQQSIELLKAYRDNRLVGQSPRRYIDEDGNEVLSSMLSFIELMKAYLIVGVDDYKLEISNEGLHYLDRLT